MKVNMHEAKTNLSRLIASVESGALAEVEIARAGKVVARIVPAPKPMARTPGGWEGRVRINDDFDDPIPGFDEAFPDDPR